jgi:competence protein ComEC
MKIVWWGVGLLLVMCGVVWRQWPSSTAVVTMCDVGQGDGLVVTQGFSQMVVDVGAPQSGILACLSRIMPFWDNQIEIVVITHMDSDHVGALEEMLARYTIGEVVASELSKAKITKIIGNRSRVVTIWAGQRWNWGGVVAHVLWPEPQSFQKDTNENSLVVRMELSTTESIWLAGDIDERIESTLLKAGVVLPSTILKVAHHGSGTATSEPFLEVLRPSQAWISVGKDNRYGHPSREIIDRLMKRGITIRRTDEVGMIQMKSNF